MVRRYADPIEVRPPLGTGAGAEERSAVRPGSFLWHGRLYVVRSILGHWRERRAWWNESAAQAVHGASIASGEPGSGAPLAPRPPRSTELEADLEAEREVWRVEASAGRHAGVGVYELCHDPGRGASGTWSLLRVTD